MATAPPQALARTLELDSPAERAAAELRGWLEAGERVVALLAPRGALRRRALERLAASVEGRFVAARWTGDRPPAPRASTLDEVRGKAPRTLFLVEDGERLGAEGARVLRALAHDPAKESCVAVALEAEEAGAVLGGLGPELEIVVLRDSEAGRRKVRGALRLAVLGAALGLAGVSLGIALALLLPRFGPPPKAPVEAAAIDPGPAPPPAAALPAVAALPPVAAPPPAASAPERAASAPERAASAPERAASARKRAVPRGETPARPAASARTAHRAPPPARAPALAAAAPPPAPGAGSPPAVAAAPPPQAGWLVVNAIPRAWIALDGAALGETPIVRHPVAGGSHLVSARFEDGREDRRRVQIAGGELYLMFDGRPQR